MIFLWTPSTPTFRMGGGWRRHVCDAVLWNMVLFLDFNFFNKFQCVSIFVDPGNWNGGVFVCSWEREGERVSQNGQQKKTCVIRALKKIQNFVFNFDEDQHKKKKCVLRSKDEMKTLKTQKWSLTTKKMKTVKFYGNVLFFQRMGYSKKAKDRELVSPGEFCPIQKQ